IVKGINESKLVKNSLEHDREIYLLKQELKGLKTAQQLTDTPKEEQVEKVEEISIKEEVPKEEIGEKGDREYDESSN
ncbi:MAG: hypothetical protein NDN66_07675, partial [Carnobacterium sp.]|nr:hypothetical protein [Carnobacterium sp.]